MRKFLALLIVVAVVTLATATWAKSSTKHSATADGSGISASTFAKKAGAAGLAEVKLSELAIEKSENPDVKRFARMMVDDHSKANEELASIAKDKHLSLPTTLGASQKTAVAKLRHKSGTAFDRAYMAQMVHDHAEAVALFTKASTQASDDEVRAFASKTLPTIEHHQEEATSLKAQVGAPATQSRR